MNTTSTRERTRTEVSRLDLAADYAASLAFIGERLSLAASMRAAAADLMDSPLPLDVAIARDLRDWALTAISEALYEMKALPMRDGRDA